MRLLFVGIVFCCVQHLTVATKSAAPVLTAIHPSKGPSSGGFRVEVYGRELAFLDSDIQGFVGGFTCKNPRVQIGWQKFSIELPPCPGCGKTQFNVMILGQRSNFIDFLFTDECAGPTGNSSMEPVLPEHWSARENCTLCTEIIHLAVSTLRDNFEYKDVVESLSFVCTSAHISNFSSPLNMRCQEDFTVPCRILVETRSTRMANFIWDNWDKLYFQGKLPLDTCREVQYCSPHILAPRLPDGTD